MKRCSKCKKSKSNSSFARNRTRKDGYHSSCKSCHKNWSRVHYEQNKDYYKEKGNRNRTKTRDEMRKLIRKLKSVPCTDCGKKYPYYVMDFDHVRGKKVLEIPHMVARQAPRERILKEIKKCDVVCANCHRIRTHARLA